MHSTYYRNGEMTLLIRFRLYILLLILFCSGRVFADWPCRIDSVVPIATNPGNQWNVHVVTSHNGAVIYSWQDRRNGTTDKIYLQCTNPSGKTTWPDGGLQLATTAGFQYYPQMISDGAGGVIVAWQDNRSGVDYDVYVQRITAEGNTSWFPNGAVGSDAPGHQYNPQLVSDGLGGCILTWQDKRGGGFDVYAQRFNAVGQRQWAANGIAVCSSPYDQIEPKIIADGTGGAVISWLDYRGGSGSTDIFCQRIQSNGSPSWSGNGVPVCVAPNTQWNLQIADDGLGNCIMVWQDRRTGLYDNVYAQKIDAFGTPMWSANGLAVAPISGVQYYPQVVGDRVGGLVVVWQDNRLGADYDIYAQHLNASGAPLWAATGVALCSAPSYQYNPQIVSQGSSYVVTWQDKRSGNFDIYGQRFQGNGQMLWNLNGSPVALINNDQFMPQLVSDGAEGAVIAWADYHLGGSTTDIFAHRIGSNGLPAGGCYRTFTQDKFGLRGVTFRRRPATPVIAMPNEGNVRDSVFGRGAFAQGVYVGVERFDLPKQYGWEYFTRSVYVRRALPQNGTPRPLDRIYERRLVGMLKNPSLTRYNNRLSGELLTLKFNIAASDVGLTPPYLGELIFFDATRPTHPMNNLSLRQVTARADSMMTYYSNYPGLSYSFISSALSSINNSFTGVFDTLSTYPMSITPTNALFSVPFLLPAKEPPPAPMAFTAQQVEEEVPGGFILLQNYPNPFNPLTEIEFNVPELSTVTLAVYNTLGQQVALLIDHSVTDVGRQVVDFDASTLASGVYFYRLVVDPVAGTGRLVSQVKKMLLVK